MLRGVDADMYITGELGHHEILHATKQKHACCILVEHSNSERGYLKDVLIQKLSHELQKMGDHDGTVLLSKKDIGATSAVSGKVINGTDLIRWLQYKYFGQQVRIVPSVVNIELL